MMGLAITCMHDHYSLPRIVNTIPTMRIDHFSEDRFDCDRMGPGHLDSMDQLFRQSRRYQLRREKLEAAGLIGPHVVPMKDRPPEKSSSFTRRVC